ncbi:MAG: molybdopterin-dependent oxidoreductase [Acidimicrobiales bacterium]
MTEHSSFCRICAAACGIVVTVENDHVAKVRGDADHPISRGYTCEKGRALPQWHHGKSRLNTPSLRGKDVGWEETLDDLAEVIANVTETVSPDVVGLYLATGLAYDSAGQVACGMWMSSIRSSSFYTAATVDNAPVLVAAEEIAGHPMLNPVWEPQHSRLLIMLATNPVVSHGYGTTLADPVRRLREFQVSGGTLWTLDPRQTETAMLSDAHLALRPGSDVILLAALVRELLADQRCTAALVQSCRQVDIDSLSNAVAPFALESAVLATGCTRDQIDQLLLDLKTHHGRIAMFCGTGSTMAKDGVLVEWLRWVLLAMTDSLDVVGGMRFNRGVVNQLSRVDPTKPQLGGPPSRPELDRVAGQMPVAAMIDEIESGSLRVLVVAGGNPLSAFPEPDRFRRAAALLDALVVIDVADSELCDLATHVFPATGQLERADLTLAEQVSFRSGMQYASAVVDAAEDRKPVWWILASLAFRTSRPMFGGALVDALSDEVILTGLLAHGPLDAVAVIDAGAHGIDLEPEYGWVRSTMTIDGKWSIAPAVFVERLARHIGPEIGLVLIPRRESAWSNSVVFAGNGDEAIIQMSNEDGEAASLRSGDWIAVTSAHGSLVGVVELSDRLRTGVVSVTHGHPGSLTGTLTSNTIDVDPLTAMPWASGLPVRVDKLGV